MLTIHAIAAAGYAVRPTTKRKSRTQEEKDSRKKLRLDVRESMMDEEGFDAKDSDSESSHVHLDHPHPAASKAPKWNFYRRMLKPLLN